MMAQNGEVVGPTSLPCCSREGWEVSTRLVWAEIADRMIYYMDQFVDSPLGDVLNVQNFAWEFSILNTDTHTNTNQIKSNQDLFTVGFIVQ